MNWKAETRESANKFGRSIAATHYWCYRDAADKAAGIKCWALAGWKKYMRDLTKMMEGNCYNYSTQAYPMFVPTVQNEYYGG
jgi:hypothetical protein